MKSCCSVLCLAWPTRQPSRFPMPSSCTIYATNPCAIFMRTHKIVPTKIMVEILSETFIEIRQIMSNLQIRTAKLVHDQAEFILLANPRRVGVCVNIRTNIICFYSSTQRQLALVTQKSSNRYSDLRNC